MIMKLHVKTKVRNDQDEIGNVSYDPIFWMELYVHVCQG